MTLSIVLSSVVLFLLLIFHVRKRSRYPLPPSLKGWPIIGNALDIPSEHAGVAYASWAKRLGSEIISATALGNTIIVLDTVDAAIELFEKRATKYSDRPTSVMVNELMGWSFLFVMMPYSSPVFKLCRRLFVQFFRTVDGRYQMGRHAYSAQTKEAIDRLVVEVARTPDDALALVRQSVGGFAISVAYGLPTKRRNDPRIEFVDSVARIITEKLTPGSNMVDIFPWLRYVPEWCPGAGFKRYARSVWWMSERYRLEPYEAAVKSFGDPDMRPSFLSGALSSLDGSVGEGDQAARKFQLEAIKDTAATIYGTVTDTTTSAIQTYIFALATHPHVRKRVQMELDNLLIGDMLEKGKRTVRLPTIEDQEKLPYLMASVMESLRWVPVAPLGMPRMTAEDDVYDGYFIPKGSIVIGNAWSMLHNEDDFGPDVNLFNPERFLVKNAQGSIEPPVINTSIRHPATVAFGFGRRICPGSHIALSTLWLAAASLVALFDFDASDEIKVTEDMLQRHIDPSFLSAPKPFKCGFKLRSAEAKALVADLELVVGGE